MSISYQQKQAQIVDNQPIFSKIEKRVVDKPPQSVNNHLIQKFYMRWPCP
jgi:hypothetical protein